MKLVAIIIIGLLLFYAFHSTYEGIDYQAAACYNYCMQSAYKDPARCRKMCYH